jgi:uncharacterized protein (TIGR04255 family)
MMSTSYNNPPLLEAICEIKLRPGTNWDEDFRDLFHERVKAQFPERRQGNHPTTQFRSADGSALVQVAPNLLAINQLQPYPTWAGFKHKILEAIATYSEIVPPAGMERMNLRYINRIEIPRTRIDIGRYLRGCPDSHAKLFLSAEYPFEAERENLLMILAHVPHSEGDFTRFILDLDYGAPAATMAIEEIDQRLDRAHDRILQVFENTVTDELRRLFGRKGPEGSYPQTPERMAERVRETQSQYRTAIPEGVLMPPAVSPSVPLAGSPADSSPEASPEAIGTTEAVANFRAHLQALAARIDAWQSAEAREQERWEQLEMEMGVEKDIVFEEPEVPTRIITARVTYVGREEPPIYDFDQVEDD